MEDNRRSQVVPLCSRCREAALELGQETTENRLPYCLSPASPSDDAKKMQPTPRLCMAEEQRAHRRKRYFNKTGKGETVALVTNANTQAQKQRNTFPQHAILSLFPC